MRIHPLYPKLYRNKFPGVVQTASRAGTVLRRTTLTVDPLTPRRVLWRQIFGVSRKNWLSLGPLGQNNTPTLGIDPQTAWAMENGQTFNVLLPGLIEGLVGLPTQLANIANPTAYYTSIQSTLAALGLPPRDPPAFNTSYLSSTTLTQNQNVGPYQATLTIPTFPAANPLAFSIGVGIEITGNNTTTWTASLGTAPSGVTATLSATTFSLVYDDIANSSQNGVNVTFTIAPNTPDFSNSINVTLNGPGGTATFTVNLTVTTGNLVPVLPTPTFNLPSKITCTTVYDDTFTVANFFLTYELTNTSQPAMQRLGAEVRPQWEIDASDFYTSTYSPPSAAEISPVTYNGQVWNNTSNGINEWPIDASSPAEAWRAAYGDLPTSGYIKFRVNLIDPSTGVTGPALTVTASWLNGTFRGGAHKNWLGNDWTTQALTAKMTATAVSGSNPYTVTFTGTPFNAGYAGPLAYAPSVGGTPVTGPLPVTFVSTNQVSFTAPAGAPTPTTSDVFFLGGFESSFTALTTVTILIFLYPTVQTGQPTNTDPWTMPTDTWPPNYTFPVTFTPTLTQSSISPDGLINTKFTLQPGISATFQPESLTFASEDAYALATFITITSDGTVPEGAYTLEIELTDGIYALYNSLDYTWAGGTVPPIARSFLSLDSEIYNLGLTSPGTFNFAVTIYNTSPDTLTTSMLLTTQSTSGATAQALLDTPYAIAWDQQTVDVPGGTYASPGSVTIHATLTVPGGIATRLVETQLQAVAGKSIAYATII